MLQRGVFALWLLLPLMAGAAWGQDRIPAARCVSLAGDSVSLPGDLGQRTAVLVIGFSRSSQTEVRGWSKRLAADYPDSPNVAYYEVAMLSGVPKFLRGIVVRSMKKDVPERAQGHFLPLTDDDTAWRKVVHFDNADAAYVVVIDGRGMVRWQTVGDASDDAYAELKRHLP